MQFKPLSEAPSDGTAFLLRIPTKEGAPVLHKVAFADPHAGSDGQWFFYFEEFAGADVTERLPTKMMFSRKHHEDYECADIFDQKVKLVAA